MASPLPPSPLHTSLARSLFFLFFCWFVYLAVPSDRRGYAAACLRRWSSDPQVCGVDIRCRTSLFFLSCWIEDDGFSGVARPYVFRHKAFSFGSTRGVGHLARFSRRVAHLSRIGSKQTSPFVVARKYDYCGRVVSGRVGLGPLWRPFSCMLRPVFSLVAAMGAEVAHPVRACLQLSSLRSFPARVRLVLLCWRPTRSIPYLSENNCVCGAAVGLRRARGLSIARIVEPISLSLSLPTAVCLVSL